MTTPPAQSSLEDFLGYLMLAGVAASSACMLAGLMMFIATPDVELATSIVTFGLVVLMATPGLRVAIAVVEAVRERDWFFVTITGIVVLLLCVTAWLALGHV